MFLRSYQKAFIFESPEGEKIVITQGLKLAQIVTKQIKVNNVYIQNLYDDSMGILSDNGIYNINFCDILSLIS